MINKNDQSIDDIVFWEAGSKPFKIAISSLASFFGVLFLFSFFSNINHLVADDFVMLVFGLVFCGLGFLMFRYFLNPRVRITQEELHVRGFWRAQSWALADIIRISTKKEKLKPKRSNGLPPPVIEWVVLDFADGRSDRFIAPGFVIGNGQLLNILAKRLQIMVDRDIRAYEEIPLGKSPFK